MRNSMKVFLFASFISFAGAASSDEYSFDSSYLIQKNVSSETIDVSVIAYNQMHEHALRSKKEGREYGGVIYSLDGNLMSTLTVAKGSCDNHCSVNLSKDYNTIIHRAKTENIKIYADWHTHANASDSFSEGDNNSLNAIYKIMVARAQPFIGSFYSGFTGMSYLVLPGSKTDFEANKANISIGRLFDYKSRL
jgi:hypothetical protein